MADIRKFFVTMLHVKLRTSRQNPCPSYVSLRGTGPAGKAANGELEHGHEHDLLSAVLDTLLRVKDPQGLVA